MSVFTPFKLAGLACVGVGGTCSMVYAGSSLLDFSQVEADDDSVIQTVADKFSTRLISSQSRNKGVWEERLRKLKSHKDEDGDLDKTLKDIRDDNKGKKTEKDLKDWCEGAKIKPHEGDEFKLIVKGVEDYCTYVIKDQANGLMKEDGSGDWSLVNKKFMGADKKKLSEALQKVHDKVKEESSEDLKKWCFENYKKPFMGRDDLLYKEVAKFCTIVKAPKTLTTGPEAAEPQGSVPTGDGPK